MIHNQWEEHSLSKDKREFYESYKQLGDGKKEYNYIASSLVISRDFVTDMD